jgi:hypothetical protein
MPASSGERKNPAVGHRREPDRTERPRFGRPVKNSFHFFRFLAPNRPLRATWNPRVDGSFDSDRPGPILALRAAALS